MADLLRWQFLVGGGGLKRETERKLTTGKDKCAALQFVSAVFFFVFLLPTCPPVIPPDSRHLSKGFDKWGSEFALFFFNL